MFKCTALLLRSRPCRPSPERLHLAAPNLRPPCALTARSCSPPRHLRSISVPSGIHAGLGDHFLPATWHSELLTRINPPRPVSRCVLSILPPWSLVRCLPRSNPGWRKKSNPGREIARQKVPRGFMVNGTQICALSLQSGCSEYPESPNKDAG